jgi:Tol biopolymer transport system component
MNNVDRLERELTSWFADAAVPRTPDYTDDILRQTVRVRQRPRWSFPERWLPMSVITLGRPGFRPVPWRTIGLLAILTLLLAVAIGGYVGSQPKLPPPFGPAGNGLVAISIDGDIVLADPFSGATIDVVAGPTLDLDPAWSPDGTRIAFLRSVAGGENLATVSGTGDQLRLLMTDPVEGIQSLTWSPDGSALASTNGDLWIVAADGSGSQMFDVGFWAEYPLWRPPDGRQILLSNGSNPGMFLVQRDGTVLRQLTFPDGTLVDDEGASWTPDGRRLLARDFEAGAARIHVLTIADDGRITEDKVIGSQRLDCLGDRVAPDGSRVLFGMAAPGGVGWRIGVISIDGSGPIISTGPTFTGPQPICTWSPDGTVIILNDTPKPETWLLDPDGGAGRRADWIDTSGEPWAWQRVVP